jgi:hypothetical protein
MGKWDPITAVSATGDMPASRAYSDCRAALSARPLRIVMVFRDELAKDDVAVPQVEGGARLVQVQSMSLGPSAVMTALPG